MEETILKDIRRIENKDYYRAEDLQTELVAKYRGEILHIDEDLDQGYVGFSSSAYDVEPNYLSNLINIKAKLEVLLAKMRDEKNKPQTQPVSPIKLDLVNNNNSNSNSDNHSTNSSDNNNTLSNTNNNTVDVKLLFEDAKNKIEDDTSLGEEELQEILAKINELEELHDSDERPRNKWNKSKEVMTWVLTKGAKVASIVLPLITEVIKQ